MEIIPTLVDAVTVLLYAIAALVYAIDSLLSSGLAQWIGGGIVTLFFYYVAREDSRREAKELKRLNTMMMNAMEAAGWVKWVRDENGDPTGRVVELSGRIEGRSNLSATGTPTVTYSAAGREHQAPSELGKEPPSSKE